MTRRSEWTRIALTGCIGFHLFSVILAPNSQSYLGTTVAGVVEPYINFLELTNSWSFFAPDPGPPPVFLQFEVFDKSGASLGRGRWPDFPDTFFLRERQNRRVAAAEFMMVSGLRSERMMVPYLCGKTPGAHSVSLHKSHIPIPTIWDVRDGKAKLGDEDTLERTLISHNFCGDKS